MGLPPLIKVLPSGRQSNLALPCRRQAVRLMTLDWPRHRLGSGGEVLCDGYSVVIVDGSSQLPLLLFS